MTVTEEGVKKLGFGLMRLPQKDGAIDIEQTKTMVDMFLNAGFNYFDTAWAYQGSEDAIRQALVERYPRDSYFLATKNAAWINCKTREEAIDQFETSLRRTGAGYFDFYLLHNLGESRTHFFEDFDLWNWAFGKKREGLIKHVGFSFHSTPEELEAILTAHPEAEFVQLQINYADWDNPAIRSRECYEVARRHGKPVGSAMPAAARLPYMIAELAVWAAVSGLFSKKIAENAWVAFPAVLIAAVSGRAVFVALAAIFSAVSPLDAATAWAQVQSGFIGLIAQAVVVPLIVIGLRALLVKNDGRA